MVSEYNEPNNPPTDELQLAYEIDQISRDVNEIAVAIRSMGKVVDMTIPTLIVQVETLRSMLFGPDGLLESRTSEFMWRCNRQTLMIIQNIYKDLVRQVITTPMEGFQP